MKLLVFFIIFLFIVNNTTFAQEKTVYTYQDGDSSVPEFTDIPSPDQEPKHAFTIKPASATQKQSGAERMEQIKKYNEDFNKRYYGEKKRQYNSRVENTNQQKSRNQQEIEERKKYVDNIKHPYLRQIQQREDRLRLENGVPLPPVPEK